MAYILSPDDEENPSNSPTLSGTGQQTGGSSNPTLSEGSGGAPTSGAGSGTNATGNAKPAGQTSSGNYTNINKYLAANADQSPADQITNNIMNQGNTAKSDLSNATNQFDTQSQAGYTPYSQSTVDNALKDPVKTAGDKSLLSAFSNQYNDSYSGPKDLTSISGWNPGEGQNVSSLVNQTSTEPGQKALLQQFESRPSYSQGEQNLDQALLQNNPLAQSQFSNLRSTFGDLGNQYDQASNNAQNTAQGDQQNAQTASTYAKKALGDTTTGIQNDITGKVKSDQDLLSGLTSDLGTAYKQGNFSNMTDPQLAQTGLSSLFANGDTINNYGINPADYWTPAADINNTTVASKDQALKLGALATLGGGVSAPFIDPNSADVGRYSDPTAVLGHFDQSGYDKAVSQATGAYDTALSSPLDASNPILNGISPADLNIINTYLTHPPSDFNNGQPLNLQDIVHNITTGGSAEPNPGVFVPGYNWHLPQLSQYLDQIKNNFHANDSITRK